MRSGADAGKVKRIRNDPRSRVAPCLARGRPLGSPAEGRAPVLDHQNEKEPAEAALRAHYGLGRKIYEGASEAVSITTVYLELTVL